MHGDASEDADFEAGSDRVRYSVDVAGHGPFTVEAELWYQTIAYRWAENLKEYMPSNPGGSCATTNRWLRHRR